MDVQTDPYWCETKKGIQRNEISSSYTDSTVIESDLGQETTNYTCPVDNNAVTSVTIENNTENGVHSKSDISVMYHCANIEKCTSNSSSLASNINLDQVKTSNTSDSSVLEDNTIKTDDASKDYLRYISQDENVPERFKKARQSVTLTSRNALCCKILIIFAVCCIIGCFLIPISLYYESLAENSDKVNVEYSNTSSAKIKLMKTCNFSDSDCVDQILYIYEALRTINLPSSQQYCSERVETLFCDALMECSNESYVKDIVCQQVRQEYCTAEWRMLELHNQTDGLIDCEEYNETAPLTCSDQFDVTSDGSVCLPLCGEFSQFSKSYNTPRLVFYTISHSINVTGGMIVIAISIWKRKKMFQFPQVLVIINAGIMSIMNFLVFISTVTYIGRWYILCSSKFLFDAIDNPTAFCTLQGCLFFCGVVLYSYIWLLYIGHLALKLFYPLKSAKISNSDYHTAIYIGEVMIALLIASVPSIVNAGLSKYKISIYPPTYCANDRPYNFYVTAVPILAAVFISLILMLLVLHKVHIHNGIFKRKHQRSGGKQVCTYQFTVPEIKIAFVLLYWLVLAIMLWTSISRRTGHSDVHNSHIRSYADCMAGGNRKDHDCHMLRQVLEAEASPVVEVIYLLLVAFLNFASLPFVIQYQTVQHSVRKASRKISIKLESYNSKKKTSD